MQFIIYALDRPGAGPLRAKHREAHRARLREHDHPLKIVAAGPLLEGDDPVGSLIIVEANGLDDVRAFVNADPYIAHGVYESADIRPVKWTVGTPPGG